MRLRILVGLVIAGAGCSLFVDTGGFDEPVKTTPDGGGASDAPIVVADTSTPAEDATTTNDAATSDGGDAAVGPVGDWPFDEGSGNVLMDHSGRSHNGIVSGGLWVDDKGNAPGQALAFDGGPNNFVTIAGDPDFSRGATTSFSMFAWARFDETPSHDIFFSVWYGNQDSSFGVELINATELTYWDSKNHSAIATVPNVVGQWHHYGVVVDAGQARMYFDGVRVSQGVADTTPRTATQVFFGHSSFGDYLRGAIDKARFFRVALTDAEMMAEKNR